MTETNKEQIQFPEYYTLVWTHIHEKYEQLLTNSNIKKPKEIRSKLVKKYKDKINNKEHSYEALMAILNDLENEFKKVISKHSCFYWLHLFRRIAPVLSPSIGNRTDETTTMEVRDIAEQAIFKFGTTSGKLDLLPSNSIPFNKILGGILQKILSGSHAPIIEFYKHLLASNKQLVIGDFRASDLADIYKIEGLAYQYWYIGAKLRASGKGVKVFTTDDESIEEYRTPDQIFLIENFDNRTNRNNLGEGFTSNVGTLIFQGNDVEDNILILAALNITRYPLSDFFPKHTFDKEFSPNYLPGFIRVDKYYESHKYLEKHFEKKHGFGLKEFCHASLLISQLLAGWNSLKITNLDDNGHLLYYQKFQRGYLYHSGEIGDIKTEILKMMDASKQVSTFSAERTIEQLDKILDFLTLTSKKQSLVSLWSSGPRYIFIPFQNHFICDYSAWFTIFRTLFFGLRNYDPASKKGIEFEDTFASMAKKNGLEVVIQSKDIRSGTQKREVDVGVRINNHLYLLECKAAERPIDFAIGNPKSINSRIKDFSDKISQATSLEGFVKKNKQGDNYDFSWATEVTGIVVSPYTEWIWSKSEDLWLPDHENTPRILSAHEAIDFLTSQLKESEQRHH